MTINNNFRIILISVFLISGLLKTGIGQDCYKAKMCYRDKLGDFDYRSQSSFSYMAAGWKANRFSVFGIQTVQRKKEIH